MIFTIGKVNYSDHKIKTLKDLNRVTKGNYTDDDFIRILGRKPEKGIEIKVIPTNVIEAKVIPPNVIEIAKLLKDGEKQKDIAETFGIKSTDITKMKKEYGRNSNDCN